MTYVLEKVWSMLRQPSLPTVKVSLDPCDALCCWATPSQNKGEQIGVWYL